MSTLRAGALALLAMFASSAFLCDDPTNRDIKTAPVRFAYYTGVKLPPSTRVLFFHEESALDQAVWLKLEVDAKDAPELVRALGFDPASLKPPSQPDLVELGSEEDGYRPSREQNLKVSEQRRTEALGYLQLGLVEGAPRSVLYVFYFTT